MYQRISKYRASWGIKNDWPTLLVLAILLQKMIQTEAAKEPERNVLLEQEKGG